MAKMDLLPSLTMESVTPSAAGRRRRSSHLSVSLGPGRNPRRSLQLSALLAGSLLVSSLLLLLLLLHRGIHPTLIYDALHNLSLKYLSILHLLSIPVDLADTDTLTKLVATSLSSKVVSKYSSLLVPLAVLPTNQTAPLPSADPISPPLSLSLPL